MRIVHVQAGERHERENRWDCVLPICPRRDRYDIAHLADRVIGRLLVGEILEIQLSKVRKHPVRGDSRKGRSAYLYANMRYTRRDTDKPLQGSPRVR